MKLKGEEICRLLRLGLLKELAVAWKSAHNGVDPQLKLELEIRKIGLWRHICLVLLVLNGISNFVFMFSLINASKQVYFTELTAVLLGIAVVVLIFATLISALYWIVSWAELNRNWFVSDVNNLIAEIQINLSDQNQTSLLLLLNSPAAIQTHGQNQLESLGIVIKDTVEQGGIHSDLIIGLLKDFDRCRKKYTPFGLFLDPYPFLPKFVAASGKEQYSVIC